MNFGKMIKDLIGSLWKKPSTITVAQTPAENTRGRIYYNNKLCTKCGLCIKTCPSNAIQKDPTNEIVFLLDRCLSCGQCVDMCIKDCITITSECLNPKTNRLEFQISSKSLLF